MNQPILLHVFPISPFSNSKAAFSSSGANILPYFADFHYFMAPDVREQIYKF